MAKRKNHYCAAIIFSCIDWRLYPALGNYLRRKYGHFDFCASAGSVKGFLQKSRRQLFFDQIKISQKLHHSRTIILTMHHDCGGWGGIKKFKNEKQEFSYHQMILSRVAKLISIKFPKAETVLYFIGLKEKQNEWLCLPQKHYLANRS